MVGIIYFANNNNNNDSSDLVRTIHSECSLSERACEVAIGTEHVLRFELKPKSLPVMEPILLAVSNLSKSLLLNKAWFEGKDMYMGKHYLLAENESRDDFNQPLELKGMVPVCHIGSAMTWYLIVELSYQEELIQVYFEQDSTVH